MKSSEVKLKDLLSVPVQNGYSPICSEEPNGFWILGLNALSENGIDINGKKPAPLNDKRVKQFLLKSGDFLMSRSNTPDKVGRSILYRGEIENCSYPDLMMKFRVNENKIFPEYLEFYLKSPKAMKYLRASASGTSASMVKINKTVVEKIPVYLPSYDQQKKIAIVGQEIIHAIETTERLIAAKEQYFDGLSSKLMHNLLFSKVHVYQITSEVSIRNKDNCIRVLSVTNKNGFVLPEDHFDRRVASENVSNYKLVKKGQYAYNPSRINVGSIARLDEWDEGILSPMYTIFEIDEAQVNSDFFLHWLSSYNAKQRIKKSAQGSVRETVSFSDFGAITIPLPSIEEQNKIAEILNTAKREIDLLKKLAESYRLQKWGLMQKLLSGELHLDRQKVS